MSDEDERREKLRIFAEDRAKRDAWGNEVMEFGAERPIPGREGEYIPFDQGYGGSGPSEGGPSGGEYGGGYSPPPSIDEERRSRSPGLSRNFYDSPTSDFKRPYTGGGGGGGRGAGDGDGGD